MMKAKLLFRFVVVLYLFTTGHLGYASMFPGSMEEVEVMKHLNRLNKPPVKSIKSPDGDIIDCVHISHQPAFDHPLLKKHTIKMRPKYYPNSVNEDNIKMTASKVGRLTSSPKEAIAQLWHLNGKCPKGTIPIIRTNKEDVLRADSVESYGKKLNGVGDDHEYAHATTDDGIYHGTQATFNLWNPKVQEPNEFSLSQLWISRGSDPNLNTIEAGWHVYPDFNGDNNTRLFIYWTSDSYLTTGCYNLKCPGFIQTNNEIALGGIISPTSQVEGSQYEITILIWKDTEGGDWWMQLDGEDVGYWPASLFSLLNENASELDFGGEVVNKQVNGQHTTTQMGSGYFPQEGYGKASYIRNIQMVDESNTLRTPEDLNSYAPQMSCYDIVKGINDNTWGSHFFFGGPGRNQNCP